MMRIFKMGARIHNVVLFILLAIFIAPIAMKTNCPSILEINCYENPTCCSSSLQSNTNAWNISNIIDNSNQPKFNAMPKLPLIKTAHLRVKVPKRPGHKISSGPKGRKRPHPGPPKGTRPTTGSKLKPTRPTRPTRPIRRTKKPTRKTRKDRTTTRRTTPQSTSRRTTKRSDSDEGSSSRSIYCAVPPNGPKSRYLNKDYFKTIVDTLCLYIGIAANEEEC
ncbi:uncharacterized protein LOC142223468 isoform X2 [Haematobia irritans]|uniref:uncharacterized protein LOC142223468 isoform X2 n=1 Tax=Haematobia irritans TaxID=7368 RepID=UPI003F4FA104